MRLGLDATPLLGPRTGVGHYTGELVRALLAATGPAELAEVALVPFSWRGREPLERYAATDPRLRVRGRRAPARLLRAAWARGPVPPVEWLSGPLDVFHATNFVLPPLRRAAGVVTVHDLTYLHHPEWVAGPTLRYRSLVPAALRRAGAVCTVSAAVRAELLAAYPLDPDRVVVTPNGVDHRCLTAVPPDPPRRRALGLPAEYVLFLGTLEPRKGLAVLLSAWRLLHAGGADLPALLVAGGAGWGAPPDLAGLPAGAVRLLGYVDHGRVPELLAGARLLAFPSRYEGFGLPPLDALGCGTAVVASDLPVLREVLGEHACFAPPGDPQAWAVTLERALAAEPAGPDRRAARRAHAAAFGWARCAARTRAAYAVALAG